MMKMSPDGLALLKQWEALRTTPYRDVPGFWTIGWGHKIDMEHDEFDSPIDEVKAEELLKQDVANSEDAVNDLVHVPLTAHQFDALVAFSFNVGRRNLAQSTLLRKLNQGDYLAVPHELAKWVNAGGQHIEGLVNRRKAEIALWNSTPKNN